MKVTIDYTKDTQALVSLFAALEQLPVLSQKKVAQTVRAHKKSDGTVFAKDELVAAYAVLAGTQGLQPKNERISAAIRMKPMRTQSGVAPITVLTKPFPCPGKCIFCPSDVRMPKSYLADEPGAQRAERNWFDPYLQTYNRLQALSAIGHDVSKAEIIVLGGTWSYYPEQYQIWFITECFRALNDFGVTDTRQKRLTEYERVAQELSHTAPAALTNDPVGNKAALVEFEVVDGGKTLSYNQTVSRLYTAPEMKAGVTQKQTATWEELEQQHLQNQDAQVRCVGLVVETRPDNISQAEVIRMRRLGCTKTQIGFQSLNDSVLAQNKRGHTVAATRKAVALLRQAGFKIHAHWMANLHGSSVALDKKDYGQVFSDPDFRPDELKVYPCSLIGSAELMQYYKKGLWKPYSYEELLSVLEYCLLQTPQYCRLTRIIRDIPSTDIVVGNKHTNFRQIAEQSLAKAGLESVDIRAREIRGQQFNPEDLELESVVYGTSASSEVFLQFVLPAEKSTTKKQAIVAFLRLSLPNKPTFIPELEGAALIREVHVYGSLHNIGEAQSHKPQHLGLGKKLIAAAQKIAQKKQYKKIAVISAIGTRRYYEKQGFVQGPLYQSKVLS